MPTGLEILAALVVMAGRWAWCGETARLHAVMLSPAVGLAMVPSDLRLPAAAASVVVSRRGVWRVPVCKRRC